MAADAHDPAHFFSQWIPGMNVGLRLSSSGAPASPLPLADSLSCFNPPRTTTSLLDLSQSSPTQKSQAYQEPSRIDLDQVLMLRVLLPTEALYWLLRICSALIQVSQSVLCAGPSTQCVSPGSSETSWLQLKLCCAPAGTGSRMCKSTDTRRNPPKPAHPLFEQAQTQQGSSMASLRFCLLLCCKNKLSNEYGSFFSLTSSFFLSFLLPPVEFWTFSPPISALFSLLLSLSPSPSYSRCHPHRTSQKCADSGCWATLPYYWSFKWKSSREARNWSAFHAGRGCCNVVWPHEFIHMLCSNKYELQAVLSASNKGNAALFDSSRSRKHHRKHKQLIYWTKYSVMVNWVIHEVN